MLSGLATGKLRAMSPYGAFAYNILTMGLIFPWVFLWGRWEFLGGSLSKGILIATLIELPIAISYVFLGTAMPRSGGDYLFQSRVLGRGVAFVAVFSGLVVWGLQWMALSGWLMAVLGIAPTLIGLGVTLENATLVEAGVAVSSPTGVVLTSVVFAALSGLLLTRGFRKYVRLQPWLFYATLMALAIVLYEFLSADPAAFAAGINGMGRAVNGAQDTYAATIAAATAAGTNVHPPFSWLATLAVAPIAWTSLQWASYSVEQGGEIEGAASFRNQMFIIVGSLVCTGGILALTGWALERAVGGDFLIAASMAHYSGDGGALGSLQPFPSLLAMALIASPVLTALVGLGFAANAFQIFCNVYIGTTRNVVAMAQDGLLPSWIARINRRFHSPTNAYFAYFVASVLWVLVYNYVPGFDRYTLGVTFASGYVFSIGSLAAAFLPYRARLLYENSPGSRYKLLGRSGVTYLGLIGAALGGAMVLSLALVPAYGLRGAAPVTLTTVILVLSLAWFNLATRRYRPLFDSPSVGEPNGVTRTDQRQGGGL